MTDFLPLHPDGVILALDEMCLYFQSTLTRVWSPVGQTPIVSVHPQRDCLYFYGALNVRDGREIALPAPAATAEMTANFLMVLLMLFPQPILLLMDRAPWHFAEVTTLLEENERIQLLLFPSACPDLNPQEHLWDCTRQAVSDNHSFRDFQSLIDDFQTHLNSTIFSTNFMDAFAHLG